MTRVLAIFYKILIFFYDEDTCIFLYLMEYYTIITDVISYCLLLNT